MHRLIKYLSYTTALFIMCYSFTKMYFAGHIAANTVVDPLWLDIANLTCSLSLTFLLSLIGYYLPSKEPEVKPMISNEETVGVYKRYDPS